MPDVGIVVDGFPTGHAGEEGIHQNKFRDFRRELRGVGVGDHQANVVPHNFSFLHAKRLNQIMNADGGALHVEAAGGNVGVSDAGKVWRDHGETLGQTGMIGFHISEVSA